MKLSYWATTLVLFSASAAAQPVDVGTGDWSSIPEARTRGEFRMNDAQMDMIEQVAAEGRCNVPGLERRRVDINVPFLIRFAEDGEVERIVLQDLSCPQLEIALGAALLQLAEAGEYRPSGQPRGWYRSQIGFAND